MYCRWNLLSLSFSCAKSRRSAHCDSRRVMESSGSWLSMFLKLASDRVAIGVVDVLEEVASGLLENGDVAAGGHAAALAHHGGGLLFAACAQPGLKPGLSASGPEPHEDVQGLGACARVGGSVFGAGCGEACAVG